MYELEDLFDKRSIVGARLEQILAEMKCTKAELYKNTRVSRPTIDKLLEGTITSKKNYETHMQKIMKYLNLTPDMLLGNTVCGQNRVRELRSMIKVSTEKMSEATGISLERLQQIEMGEEATIAELRDIALMLSTSTNVLTQRYFFEPQIGQMELYLQTSHEVNEVSGFWGHVGIRLSGSEKYMWFPITANSRELIVRMLDSDLMVIPCMNNKVLLLYMPNVEEISLSDFDCDTPASRDWDSEVSCGEIPLVVYEALEDYTYGDKRTREENLSSRMKAALEECIKQKEWTEDDISEMLNTCVIHYADGKIRLTDIDFFNDTISEEIEMVYGYGKGNLDEVFMYYCDEVDQTQNYVNMKKLAMIEVPLLKVEDAIYRRCSDEF